jgi:hypothetical protein
LNTTTDEQNNNNSPPLNENNILRAGFGRYYYLSLRLAPQLDGKTVGQHEQQTKKIA